MELRFRKNLIELVVDVDGVQVYSFLPSDATDPLWTQLMKIFKDRCDPNKLRFDNLMNNGPVLIKNGFGNLKNQWCRILKNLNCKVNKGGKIIMACCVLHNFCQLIDMPKVVVWDVCQKGDLLGGFNVQNVLIYKKGDATKEAGEVMCNVLFASWLEHNLLT
jgi:hypothetical protein